MSAWVSPDTEYGKLFDTYSWYLIHTSDRPSGSLTRQRGHMQRVAVVVLPDLAGSFTKGSEKHPKKVNERTRTGLGPLTRSVTYR